MKCYFFLIMYKLIKFFIVFVLFTMNVELCLAQSNSSNITIISSPDKAVTASAQNGANIIQVINSPGLGFASTLNIGLISVALGLAVAAVWDGDGSNSEQSSSSSSTTN